MSTRILTPTFPIQDIHIRKHFQELEKIYGDVLCWNLVNAKGYELKVGGAMTQAVKAMRDPRVKYTHFDFHHECRKMQWHNIRNLFQQFDVDLKAQGYTVFDASKGGGGGVLTAKQTSVVRTNCMDCLDRTNVVQSELARSVLAQQLASQDIIQPGQSIKDHRDFDTVFKNVWADNADAISLQYSGTGALKTDFTRTGKRTKAGLVQDGVNSVTRYVKNNFMDGSRQDALDLLLGRFVLSPVHQLPAAPVHTPRYYVLPAAVVFALIMIVVSLIFITGMWCMCVFGSYIFGMVYLTHDTEWTSAMTYVAMWTAVAAVSWNMILKRGEEFVQLPTLINPYLIMEPMHSPGRVVVDEKESAGGGSGSEKLHAK